MILIDNKQKDKNRHSKKKTKNSAPRNRQSKPKGTASDPEDIDSGNESDGKSALRDVEAQERAQGARRGPRNASMQHFHDPTPTVDGSGAKRWEFRCKYCRW
jgi:hypothetical protein